MGQFTFLKFIQDQWWKVAPVEHVDLTGKTVVVIGANVGLGFEAAKHFASMNPKRLVLGCRSQEKGQAALQGKRPTFRPGFFCVRFLQLSSPVAVEATGFKNAEPGLVDLTQFTSVSAFAETFIRDNAQIDILIYNAAVLLRHYSPSKDGWEES
jgi:NAD(P)-dependent dehydrogenase (short-subunit alcohol dehydrogenase family)